MPGGDYPQRTTRSPAFPFTPNNERSKLEQTSGLLYRRFPVGRAAVVCSALRKAGTSQACNTADRRSALLRLGPRGSLVVFPSCDPCVLQCVFPLSHSPRIA